MPSSFTPAAPPPPSLTPLSTSPVGQRLPAGLQTAQPDQAAVPEHPNHRAGEASDGGREGGAGFSAGRGRAGLRRRGPGLPGLWGRRTRNPQQTSGPTAQLTEPGPPPLTGAAWPDRHRHRARVLGHQNHSGYRGVRAVPGVRGPAEPGLRGAWGGAWAAHDSGRGRARRGAWADVARGVGGRGAMFVFALRRCQRARPYAAHLRKPCFRTSVETASALFDRAPGASQERQGRGGVGAGAEGWAEALCRGNADSRSAGRPNGRSNGATPMAGGQTDRKPHPPWHSTFPQNRQLADFIATAYPNGESGIVYVLTRCVCLGGGRCWGVFGVGVCFEMRKGGARLACVWGF